MSHVELSKILEECGLGVVPDDDIKSMLATVDGDNDGTMNFVEFTSLIVLIRAALAAEDDNELVAVSEEAQDGGVTLSADQLVAFTAAFNAAGEYNYWFIINCIHY